MEDRYDILCLVGDQSNKGVLLLCEKETYKITLQLKNLYFEGEAENYFYALVELRKKLEIQNIKLLCKGCSEHVYPSPMILSMGDAVMAYKLTLGKQAFQKDLVNIFEPCKCDEYATVEQQYKYYERWIASIGNGDIVL